ncbi:hypothetical protein Tco_1395344, partial [Tanacetum coccineum]
MALPPRDQRHQYLRVQVFDFGGLSDLMADGLSARMLMEHRDAQGIPYKGDPRDYWIGISSAGDILGTALSYTLIRDPIFRLCHNLIACSIAGRSQAPENVTVTDLLYLRGMDVGSVNVPYLLARYLRLFATGRKKERLRGLIVIAPELPVIDMAELVRLQICVDIDDTWAWVAMGPERQLDAAAGTPGVAQDAPAVDEGV